MAICLLFAFYWLSLCLFLFCDLSGDALFRMVGLSWNHPWLGLLSWWLVACLAVFSHHKKEGLPSVSFPALTSWGSMT